MRSECRPRAGFTLVELLIVMGIIAALAGLTAVMYQSFGGNNMSSRAADRLQGAALGARQQARRDNRPTGLRFIMSATNPNVCTEVQYIQQPDDFAIGMYMGPANGNTSAALLRLGVNLDPTTGDPAAFPVLAGDYLEVQGGGLTHQIFGISPGGNPGDYVLSLNPPNTGGVPLPAYTPAPGAGATTNYRIIAQPRATSEPSLTFSGNTGIDFTPNASYNGSQPLSNVPVRAGQREILFGQSGAVVGSGTGSGMIVLWVRDLSVDNSTDRFAGKPILVVVQPRTGFVSAHPVSAGPDPYAFPRQGRNSGM